MANDRRRKGRMADGTEVTSSAQPVAELMVNGGKICLAECAVDEGETKRGGHVCARER